MTYGKKNKQQRFNRNSPPDSPDIGLSKDFKEIIINIFTDLKENVLKELKENMVIMSELMGNQA